MNASFIRAKATAHRLIKRNGVLVQWVRPARTTSDDVTGEPIVEVPEKTQDLWVVILPVKSGPNMDVYKGEDGTLDLSKVRNVLISTTGMTFDPVDLDRVTVKGETWIYSQAMDVKPDAETHILQKGILRRI